MASSRGVLAAILLVVAGAEILLAQQAPAYRAGQAIEWRDKITNTWNPGTFIGATPGNTQPIILQKPGDAGSQTSYNWDEIRLPAPPKPPVGPAPVKPIPPLPLPGPQPVRPIPPLPLPGPQPVKPGSEISGATAPDGDPVTEEEVKKFVTDRIGDRPFDDSPKLQRTILELYAFVKRRGTKFMYLDGKNEFGEWLGAHGISSIGPMNHNFGRPNDQNWLFGTWVCSITGLPVKYVEGDKLYKWQEFAVDNTGVLSIFPNGTYRWQTDGQDGTITGKWRPATVEEMGDQGGAGVILEKAKGGAEWVAFKYRMANPREEWLGLCEVNRRSIRQGALRVPAGSEGQVRASEK